MTRLSSLVIQSLVTVLIGGATLTNNLQAQIDDSITVRVPFRFTVGTETIAPGTYQFSLPYDHFLLSVINVKTGGREMFPVLPERQRGVEQRGHLLFHDSEETHVLNEIYFPGTDSFSEVVERRGPGRMEAKKSSTGNSTCLAQR